MTAREATIDKETLRLIKQIILEESKKLGVKVEKIILFGSRARGDYREDSDYDILIIVKEKPDAKRFIKLQSRIRVRLYKTLRREIDLIIITKKRFEERRKLWGSLEQTAAEEGIPA